jgi:exodeoxyribonuclease-5
MINADLFDLIKSEIKKHKRVQILFMGDPAQTPPVNEKRSVVFYDPLIRKYELRTIMRQQNGNPLLDFYDKIRNNLTNINSGIIRKTVINDKGEGAYFYNNRHAFRDIVLPLFASEEAKKDIDYIKLLAWRNVTVKESNSIIRNHLFGNDANYIEKGDIIMGYRSISDKYNEYNIIENSADYRVNEVSAYETNNYGLKGRFVVVSEPLDVNHNSYQRIFIIDPTDKDNIDNYGEIHDLLVLKAKNEKNQWKKYYNFRRENILMTPILHYRDGSERPAGTRIIKDIDYGYAITIHKAQGSTYTKVVILENDINANPIIKERNQIKYVSFTRPTHSAIVLSRLTVN